MDKQHIDVLREYYDSLETEKVAAEIQLLTAANQEERMQLICMDSKLYSAIAAFNTEYTEKLGFKVHQTQPITFSFKTKQEGDWIDVGSVIDVSLADSLDTLEFSVKHYLSQLNDKPVSKPTPKRTEEQKMEPQPDSNGWPIITDEYREKSGYRKLPSSLKEFEKQVRKPIEYETTEVYLGSGKTLSGKNQEENYSISENQQASPEVSTSQVSMQVGSKREDQSSPGLPKSTHNPALFDQLSKLVQIIKNSQGRNLLRSINAFEIILKNTSQADLNELILELMWNHALEVQ